MITPDGAKGDRLKLAKTGKETWPLSVIAGSFGIPVKVSSASRSGYIRPGRVNLTFVDEVPPCATTPATWALVNGLSEKPLVKTNMTTAISFSSAHSRVTIVTILGLLRAMIGFWVW
ncbi:hypothetical protein VNO78_16071 [Psophocarpus tetragonolobus]|uniref:Uncharacterized protein n=1 Tax=Psophocarpus tetragonolobus TaxID=3891 RepID=A0AAN9SG57_PSOTE